jgi:hypothetical protein
MSSFAQSGAATATVVGPEMVGEKNKNVTVSATGYNGQQSGTATTDVVGVWADYGLYDYTTSQNLDSNSTNFKDPN